MPLRLLITAGPTQEPIDAVRYLSNRSSGRLGLALAEEAALRGHEVTLLLGPTSLSPQSPTRFHIIGFRTTQELGDLLGKHWAEHDVLIMAAAVADFRPINIESERKIKRAEGRFTLELQPTPDLLLSLAESTRDDQTVIGFALEPADGLIEAARGKLIQKKLDAIVANPLETMDSDSISASLLLKDSSHLKADSNLSKAQFASWLLDQLQAIRGG